MQQHDDRYDRQIAGLMQGRRPRDGASVIALGGNPGRHGQRLVTTQDHVCCRCKQPIPKGAIAFVGSAPSSKKLRTSIRQPRVSHHPPCKKGTPLTPTLETIARDEAGRKLSPVTWKFLSCLHRFAATSGERTVTFSSVTRAASEADIHPASVRVALQELADSGYAEYSDEHGRLSIVLLEELPHDRKGSPRSPS
jgi:hypothetical protein